MSECTEMYVYEIQPEMLAEFNAVKDQLITEARSLAGLVESATYQADAQENLFVDRMIWESAEAATAGAVLFEGLPTSPEFMSMMTGPPSVGGHFSLIAGR